MFGSVRSKRGAKRQSEEVMVSSAAGTKPRRRSERTSGGADILCSCNCGFLCGQTMMQCGKCNVSVLRTRCHAKDRVCLQCFNAKQLKWEKNRLATTRDAFAAVMKADISTAIGDGLWATFASQPGEEDLEPLLRIWDNLPPPLRGRSADEIRALLFSFDGGDGHISPQSQLERLLPDWDTTVGVNAIAADLRTLRIHTTTRATTVKWWLNDGVFIPELFLFCCYGYHSPGDQCV